jgi:hypothetical protein
MRAVEPAEPVEHNPSGKWSQHRKLQRRQERYAAMGPNCPNGHPWATNAKFSYLGYRFCITCTEMKAEARKNDPATYTGMNRPGFAGGSNS